MEICLLDNVETSINALKALLSDSVESGASIGFLPPLQDSESSLFWSNIGQDIQAGSRLLIAAIDDQQILGAVQLSFVQKPNGRHRADVEKLMVHTLARGKGVGRMLMGELERIAKEKGIQLLVLDTRLGDVASQLYEKLGYVEVGKIPHYVTNAMGEFESTVFFYKLI